MNRLTRRDRIGGACIKPLDPDCGSCGSDARCKDHWSQIADRLAAYEDTGLEPDEIPHWIPVSERLPEPEANVLIWQSYRGDAPYSNITIGHLHQESDLRRKPYWTWIAYGADMVHPKIEAWHRADFICPGNEFVTHWMPLPQPSKEEK